MTDVYATVNGKLAFYLSDLSRNHPVYLHGLILFSCCLLCCR